MEFVTQFLPMYEMSEHTHHNVAILTIVTTAIALSGIIFAWLRYAKGLKRSEKIEQSLPYRVLSNQYYIPILYEKVFSRPYAALSKVFWNDIDQKVVDATVDGIAAMTKNTGDATRKLQTGNLSDYLKMMSAGALALAALVLIAAMQS